MKTSTLLRRMFVLALAMTLVLPLLPALAEEDAGNAPQNPAVILAANPTTGYIWTVEIADEAVVSVTDDGIVQGDEQPLTGAGGLQRFESARQGAGLHHRHLRLRAFVGDGGGARVSAGVRPVGGCRPESNGGGYHVYARGQLTNGWLHAIRPTSQRI